MPTDETVRELSHRVLRVKVKLPNGNLGLGSAVVIAKNTVITNCHVVNDATNVSVVVNGEPYAASAIKADWHHDLCMLTVENLDVPAVKFGVSKNLQYDESVFTVGYPGETESPVSTFGIVNGLFPMDDSVIIRASSAFKLGASGGGAFDDAGNLIGIITLKSKGSDAYYYYMPVEWVQALMKVPSDALDVKSKKPFWAFADKERPYFMRVVYPYQSGDWDSLLAIAKEWSEREPNTAESWFYLASAEFAKKDYINAEAHFQQALELDKSHLEASESLAKISAKLANVSLASN